jgi:hypothetical protein
MLLLPNGQERRQKTTSFEKYFVYFDYFFSHYTKDKSSKNLRLFLKEYCILKKILSLYMGTEMKKINQFCKIPLTIRPPEG